MKTQLLKKLLFVFALFAATTMSAQSYTFDTDLQGWAQGFAVSTGVNNGTVSYAPSGGQSSGALKLDRLSNNANLRCPAPIDGTTKKFIKIIYRNETLGTTFRIQGTSATGALGQVLYSIPAGTGVGSGEWSTAYIDMSAAANWSASVTQLDILVRVGYVTGEAGSVFIDSIEFLDSIPPTEYSEFLQNPNFEDPTGVGFYTGTGATRSITTVAPQAGSQCMKATFTAAQTAIFWNFSNYRKAYTPGFLTGQTATVTMWVRTNRTTAAQITLKVKTTDATSTATTNQPLPVNVLTTNFTGGWEQLTFPVPLLDTNIEGLTLFFGVNWNDPNATPNNSAYNAASGDLFYFDTMAAVISATPLSTNQNTLAGVSIYPNPASDVVNVNSPNGGVISVYNTLGAKVLTEKATSNTHQLNVSGLTKGLYFFELVSEGKTSVTKFVKK